MHLNRKGLQFSRRDTWDSATLAAIIVKWLEKYKADYSQHPCKGCPAVYLSNRESHDDKEIEIGKALFLADIDKMIWAFSVDDTPDDCWLVEPSGEGEDILNSGELDWPKIEAHRNRRKEGMKLFAERFDNLWI